MSITSVSNRYPIDIQSIPKQPHHVGRHDPAAAAAALRARTPAAGRPPRPGGARDPDVATPAAAAPSVGTARAAGPPISGRARPGRGASRLACPGRGRGHPPSLPTRRPASRTRRPGPCPRAGVTRPLRLRGGGRVPAMEKFSGPRPAAPPIGGGGPGGAPNDQGARREAPGVPPRRPPAARPGRPKAARFPPLPGPRSSRGDRAPSPGRATSPPPPPSPSSSRGLPPPPLPPPEVLLLLRCSSSSGAPPPQVLLLLRCSSSSGAPPPEVPPPSTLRSPGRGQGLQRAPAALRLPTPQFPHCPPGTHPPLTRNINGQIKAARAYAQ
ncbi:hypothetical protein E2P81_ATG12076 [Venturia nashicola]|nr:hypothetical protein E2P81_ATG12076 [Venturia nashicola]